MPLLRILTLLALLLPLAACNLKTKNDPLSISHNQYSGYYVSNKFEPSHAESYVVFTNQKSFDHVFGPAVVMHDKSHRLPPNIFENDIVFAVIKRGNALVQYNVKSITTHHGTLTVSYTTHYTAQPSAEYVSPLILSAPKAKLTSIEFIENGVQVNKLPIR